MIYYNNDDIEITPESIQYQKNRIVWKLSKFTITDSNINISYDKINKYYYVYIGMGIKEKRDIFLSTGICINKIKENDSKLEKIRRFLKHVNNIK